ncbi:hypothetical protein M0654_18065 [Rhizobium sp. NTR19]|uniref:Uncharacterized protein n=1 Tax=Neorhizobium turbinariae TaxID=2937795 RepID=A0ABT0IVI3_9HYPH|nr:hypothetical protein [Neorhizobium turbinariae]MCK8781890.1 hypothetical protein [Neorhizobium turbinariae]
MASEDRWEWDSIPWLDSCLKAQAEFLALATGTQVAEPIAVHDLSASALFKNLAYYGLYGDVMDRTETQDIEGHLDGQLRLAKTLKEKAPSRCDDRVVSKIIIVAEGRRSIERKTGLIEPLGLAILGGVSEGRVRNLMSGTSAEIRSINGKIPAPDAEHWLQGRAAFWPSIWSEEPVLEEENEMTAVRVPQASDGTVFHPGLRRRSGYMIGEKGKELTIENYDAALRALSEMDVPRWRRPNPQGNWGIVKASGWTVLTRQDLNNIKD